MDAEAWDAKYAAAPRVWSAAPNRFVAAELADLPAGSGVDLAAGEGRNALWLAERGWRMTAVDFSATGIERGRAAEAERPVVHPVTWVVSDVLTWQPAAAVDLVVAAYLQLPADERARIHRQAFGMLAPGGTLLVVAHDTTNFTEGTGGPSDPAVLFTAEEVLGDLDGERFDVQVAERVARPVPAGPDTPPHRAEAERVAYDALVRLVRTA